MINLEKGENINLSKEAEGVVLFELGLGWDAASGDKKHDLDASVFILTANGRLARNEDFVFYNQLTDPNGAVKHSGDNRTGLGDGDDETLTIDLSKLDAGATELLVVASIHDPSLSVNFGQVRNAFIRISDATTKVEIARADLSEDYSKYRALVFGKLYKNGSDWKFKSDPVGEEAGLASFTAKYEAL